MTAADYRKQVNKLLHSRQFAIQKVREEKRLLAEAKEELTASLEAQNLIQQTAQDIQNKAHNRIASVVSRCLETVFGEETYQFKITFDRKRGKTEARLSFVRDGQELDPTEASGGGAVDVAAFALRLSCMLLARPRKRLLFVADEPFRFLSTEYQPRIRELLLTLAEEMGVQFVVVTHEEEIVCGKVVRL